ncbi:hypothetical protein FRB94_013210 [Tulasnella sp. JGI-2019a]|nr:hypothetical protein FRB94_013210 [Tulasnella sp. JGI-2019a]
MSHTSARRPRGRFSETSKNVELIGSILHADCLSRRGTYWPSQLDLNEVLGNDDGSFTLHFGGWSMSAQNIRLNGAILTADLRPIKGDWNLDQTFDLDFHIKNDDSVLKVVDTKWAVQNACIGCTFVGPIPSQIEAPPMYQTSARRPRGRFSETSKNVELIGSILQADCLSRRGNYWSSRLDLNEVLGNDDGSFTLHFGGWSMSAQNIRLDGAVLTADLRSIKDDWNLDQKLNLDFHIKNDDGVLKAVDTSSWIETQSMYQTQARRPRSRFSETTKDVELIDNILQAECLTRDGWYQSSLLDLNEALGNDNGFFTPAFGGWSTSAKNIRLDGAVLTADLRTIKNDWNPDQTFDLDFHITNNDGVLKVVDTKRAGENACISCTSKAHVRPISSGIETLPMYQTPARHLRGRFFETSKDVELNDGILQAECLTRDGWYRLSSLDLNEVLGNDHGSFTLRFGGWSMSAENIHLDGAVLTADLRSIEDDWNLDQTFDLDFYIKNDDGVLKFVDTNS